MTTRTRSEPAAIDVRDIRYQYPDGTVALDGLSLAVQTGEAICLAGPNGAGKSTLLLALAGLLSPEGSIRIDGADPATNQNLGLVFQDPDDQLFCPTVAEDIAFGPRNQHLSESEVARRVSEAMICTGLEGFQSRSAHHLSGGEKKRAAIAAVLACRPRILALDEPWANLDARGSRAVTEIIRRFEGTRIVASQDLYRAAEVCQRMIVIDAGHVVADAEPRDLLVDQDLLDKHGLEFGFRCQFCPQQNQ